MHKLKGEWSTKTILLDGEILTPKESQKEYNHSPDGFNWGYGGSGPAQLALAIVLKLTGKSEDYQDFKWKHIATLPQSDFEIEFEFEEKVRCKYCNKEIDLKSKNYFFSDVSGHVCPKCWE